MFKVKTQDEAAIRKKEYAAAEQYYQKNIVEKFPPADRYNELVRVYNSQMDQINGYISRSQVAPYSLRFQTEWNGLKLDELRGGGNERKASDLGTPSPIDKNERSEQDNGARGSSWVSDQISDLVHGEKTKNLPIISDRDCMMKRVAAIYSQSAMTKNCLSEAKRELERNISGLYQKDYDVQAKAMKFLLTSAVPKALRVAVQGYSNELARVMIAGFSTDWLFTVKKPVEFSDKPKVIGMEGDRFVLDSLPDNKLFLQQQFDLIYRFIQTPEGSEAYLKKLELGVRLLYKNLGLEGQEYALSSSERMKITERSKGIRGIFGWRGGGGLTTDQIQIDTTSNSMNSNLVIHELGHVFQESYGEYLEKRRKLGEDDMFWAAETINGMIILVGGYPKYEAALTKHLMSLNPKERKKVLDALVKTNFNLETEDELRIAVNAFQSAKRYK